MKIYQGFVPNVQIPGELTQVDIRPKDEAFWDRCIEHSLENHPVCGVGNFGIGKTTTVLYLLQNLVREKQKAVVFTIQTIFGEEDIFYEFVPVVREDAVSDIKVKLYGGFANKMSKMIPILHNKDALFVVDPGNYEYLCDISKLIAARYIMAASNDSKH